MTERPSTTSSCDDRSAPVAADFPLAEARGVLKDLFEPRAPIYWSDFLVSLCIAYGAVALYLRSPLLSGLQVLGFVVGAFALFRCGVFIHEIVHLPRGRLRLFRAAWNVLFGIPTLTPSFTYESHADHHNPRRFGTERDGEYLPLGRGPMSRIALYLLAIPVLPALAIIRFLVLTPLSLLHPRLRRLVLERASSYVINPTYRRAVSRDEGRGLRIAIEIAIFLELAALLALLLAGVLPWMVLAELYVLAAAAAGLNWVRTAAAHGYGNRGSPMTFADQIEDSITIPGHPLLTELLFPVGLRYHSLHHLFPSLPYHSLGIAHRRLMQHLPPDSLYRRTIRRSYAHAVLELWRSARSGAAPTRGPAAGDGTRPREA